MYSGLTIKEASDIENLQRAALYFILGVQYTVRNNATFICFIWVEIGCPPIHFKYRQTVCKTSWKLNGTLYKLRKLRVEMRRVHYY